MKVALFSTQPFEQAAFEAYNKTGEHELTYHAESLAGATLHLAAGSPAVCTFVNDHLDASVLQKLSKNGTKIVALRCAGHDSVDLKAAEANGITVVRVPAYSPHAIAEYTVGLLLSLDRKIPAAWKRVQAGNFTLDGLLGQDLHQKTIGVVGTGRIGAAVAQIFQGGFDCRVLANDLYRQPRLEQLGVQYVERDELFRESDVVCLHCPLTHETTHLINAATLQSMKPGALLVNTSRGGLIDTKALIDALESHHLGGCALDVYEGEGSLFFRQSSLDEIQDETFKRLIGLPNVLLTGHQAFLTKEAINAIAEITLMNISNFERGAAHVNLAIEKYTK